MEPKHPDDAVYEEIERQMGWDDVTIAADFGNNDKTTVAIFKIHRNGKGDVIRVEAIKHFEKGQTHKIHGWLRRTLKRLARWARGSA